VRWWRRMMEVVRHGNPARKVACWTASTKARWGCCWIILRAATCSVYPAPIGGRNHDKVPFRCSVSLAWSSPHSAYKPTLCLCLGKSNSSAYFAYDGSFKVVKHPKGSKSPLNTLALAVCSQLVPTNHNEWNGRIKTGACVSRGLPYTDTQRM
jgi:hypothetical protein